MNTKLFLTAVTIFAAIFGAAYLVQNQFVADETPLLRETIEPQDVKFHCADQQLYRVNSTYAIANCSGQCYFTEGVANKLEFPNVTYYNPCVQCMDNCEACTAVWQRYTCWRCPPMDKWIVNMQCTRALLGYFIGTIKGSYGEDLQSIQKCPEQCVICGPSLLYRPYGQACQRSSNATEIPNCSVYTLFHTQGIYDTTNQYIMMCQQCNSGYVLNNTNFMGYGTQCVLF